MENLTCISACEFGDNIGIILTTLYYLSSNQ